MRLFVAVNFTDQEYFKKIQDQLPEAKLTLTKTFHLTLKFLGEVDDARVPAIKEALSTITVKLFTLTTNHLGTFPTETYIKVIWIGVKEPDPIIQIQKEIDRRLSPTFKKEKNFHPHITLARVKHIEDKENFLKKIKEIIIEEKEFPVKKIKLIKSTLMPEGPVYEEL